jgi:hypothetical protein
VIAADADNNIRVRRADTLAEVRRLIGHTGQVARVAVHPRASLIASSSNDRTVRLWDLATGQNIQTFTGHSGTPLGLAFSFDGKRLASSSADQTVKVWDVATGSELHSLDGHVFWVRDVSISPDGRDLATAGNDGTVQVWQASDRNAPDSTNREAVALVQCLANRFEARESMLRKIKTDSTICESVQNAAIRYANDLFYYWAPMIEGHRAAEVKNWATAIDRFERVTRLAPNEALHWHWLAMASLAGNRKDDYERASDELLRVVAANFRCDDLTWVVRTCLVTPRNDKQLGRLQPDFEQALKRCGYHKYVLLYDLRRRKIPSRITAEAASPDLVRNLPESWFPEAMAWHMAGDRANAVSVYQFATSQLRKMAPLWEMRVYLECLQREVEALLGIERPSETTEMPRPTTALGSHSAVLPAENPRESLPSTAGN